LQAEHFVAVAPVHAVHSVAHAEKGKHNIVIVKSLGHIVIIRRVPSYLHTRTEDLCPSNPVTSLLRNRFRNQEQDNGFACSLLWTFG